MRSVILSTFTEHSQHFYTYIMLWYPFTRHSKHLKHFLAIMHTLMSASGAIWGSVCHLRTLHRLQKLGISRWPILPLEMLPNESLTGQLRAIHIRKKNFIIVITIRDLFSAFAWDLFRGVFFSLNFYVQAADIHALLFKTRKAGTSNSLDSCKRRQKSSEGQKLSQ